MTNSRAKGKRGELQWAAFLRDHGCADARRGQQFKGTKDSPDVEASGPFHWEVKRRQRLNLHDAVAQVREEAPDDKFGAVAWRKDRGRWVVAMDAEDFFGMIGKD